MRQVVNGDLVVRLLQIVLLIRALLHEFAECLPHVLLALNEALNELSHEIAVIVGVVGQVVEVNIHRVLLLVSHLVGLPLVEEDRLPLLVVDYPVGVLGVVGV